MFLHFDPPKIHKPEKWIINYSVPDRGTSELSALRFDLEQNVERWKSELVHLDGDAAAAVDACVCDLQKVLARYG